MPPTCFQKIHTHIPPINLDRPFLCCSALNFIFAKKTQLHFFDNILVFKWVQAITAFPFIHFFPVYFFVYMSVHFTPPSGQGPPGAKGEARTEPPDPPTIAGRDRCGGPQQPPGQGTEGMGERVLELEGNWVGAQMPN